MIVGSVTDMQREMGLAAPDLIGKGRRGKDREPALTAAHEIAEAEFDGMDGEDEGRGREARKAISDIGAEPGPGRFTEPGSIEPQDFRRGPLDSGHAAVSPQQGPPNVPPLPPQGRGILEPLPQSATPVVAGHAGPITDTIKAHQARATTAMHVAPIPRGSA
jgi:hypothetical protein